MKKKQKRFSPVLISILVLAVLGIAGYLIYQKQNTLAPTSQTSQTSPAAAKTTLNWQTFTDTEGKFLFKYPSAWAISSTSDSITIFSNRGSSIRFQLSPYPSIDFDTLYKKPDGTIDQNLVFIRTKIKNLTIDGYKATMYTNESTLANQNKSFDISLYLDKGAPVTMISANTEPSLKEDLLSTFDQVLSTLKFTK